MIIPCGARLAQASPSKAAKVFQPQLNQMKSDLVPVTAGLKKEGNRREKKIWDLRALGVRLATWSSDSLYIKRFSATRFQKQSMENKIASITITLQIRSQAILDPSEWSLNLTAPNIASYQGHCIYLRSKILERERSQPEVFPLPPLHWVEKESDNMFLPSGEPW